MDERITQIGPSIAVRIFATPTVATGRGANRSSCYRRADIGRGPPWIVASSVTVAVVPLRGIFGPCITGTARAGQPGGGGVRPTVTISVRATPPVEGGFALCRSAAVRPVRRAPRLAVKVFEVVTVAVVVGVMPLRGVIGECISEPTLVSRPQIGGVGETVFVHVPATKTVVAADPS